MESRGYFVCWGGGAFLFSCSCVSCRISHSRGAHLDNKGLKMTLISHFVNIVKQAPIKMQIKIGNVHKYLGHIVILISLCCQVCRKKRAAEKRGYN